MKKLSTKPSNNIEPIIKKLEETASSDDAYFSIKQKNNNPNKPFILANKNGLILYAANLLKAAIDKENDIGNDDCNWLSKDHDIFIEKIHLDNTSSKILKNRSHYIALENKPLVGCLGLLVIIITFMIIVTFVIIKWGFYN